MTKRFNLDMEDERLKTAVREVLHGLENPAPARASYDKKAKGLYENESDGRIHVRDALKVHKVVREEGDYGQKASKPEVAIKDAVRRTLRTGRYRQFIFDGRFESITISGQAILVDGIDESMYFALPETLKAVSEPVS